LSSVEVDILDVLVDNMYLTKTQCTVFQLKMKTVKQLS